MEGICGTLVVELCCCEERVGAITSRDPRFASQPGRRPSAPRQDMRVAVALKVCDGSPMATRGFFGRQRAPSAMAERLPPGQYLEKGFPVLTAGPTPQVESNEWTFTVEGLVAEPRTWSWDEAHGLAPSMFEGDIHCV